MHLRHSEAPKRFQARLKTALFENKAMEKVKKDSKRLSVERIYQKKTQLEHILLRPDTYIGSVEHVTQQMWVFDEDLGMNCRDVTYVPGLYKIFDEILVNAADNKQRDRNMSCIKINIDPENNTISVWNNGKGIPVVEHKVEKVFVPALIFGQLLTSSNYNDEQKKLCNIFSTKFTVETACREFKKTFKQSWYENMARAGESKIRPFEGEDFTCITFQPDLPKFKMETLDRDTVALMSRRAYDIAGASKGVKVFLNGKKLPIMENIEINNIIKIMGLQYKKNYAEPDSLKTLRYGKIMIMTDQDQDGSHIKGLLINFIHHNWPSLLRHNFLEEFITPIIKVSKQKQEIPFYSIPEFEEWKSHQESTKSWKIKYYKGLGTSTSKEAKEYFADMERHRIAFRYAGPEDDAAISLAFSKKQVDDRKEWLTNFMEGRRQRRLHGLPEELVLFSNSDNERSIPSVVDGLKPGQRKVLFTCFKRNDKREVKVAQLAGSVAEMSAYHHGEVSLMMTIINLAQNFVGSNNLNLLQPVGQFGTRLHGGKDAASPRYIFTLLSPLARLLFPAVDDNLLKNTYDDNQKVEPEWYIPIIPTVLLNGAQGIGTGWACHIPNFDVREVINNVRRMLDGDEPLPMLPSYKSFKGTVQELGPNQYLISGEVSVLDSTTIEISELPAKTWTQTYKEQVLEPMLNGTEKTQPLITDYKEYHTDTTVRFVVKMTEEKLAEAEAAGLHKVFKLQTPLTCNSMVMFDHVGCMKKYETVQDILKEFFDLRVKYYDLRKGWLLGMLGAESCKLTNQARFILEKIEGTLVIENKPKKELIRMLQEMGYDSDPVKAWKEAQEKEEEEVEESEEASASGPDYNYLLNMPMWYLTKEKKEELCKQRDTKLTELNTLKRKSPSDLWKEDLAAFVEELERVEAKEREEAAAGVKPVKGKGKPKAVKLIQKETMPSPQGRRVVPRVTTAMKADASKKIKKRVKAEDGVVMKMEFEESGAGDNPAQNSPEMGESLAARLTKKSKKETGAQGGEKGKKQTTLPFKPVKKDKRNPWSDSSGSELELSDSEAAPRERVQRRAIGGSEDEFEDWSKTKSSRKDEESDHEEGEDLCPAPDLDSDTAPEHKKKQKSQKEELVKEEAAPKSDSIDLTSQDSEEGEAVQRKPSAPPAKPAAQKGKAAAKKTLGKKPTSSTTAKGKGSDDKQPSILDALTKPKAAASKTSKSAAPGPSSDADSVPKASKTTSGPAKKSTARTAKPKAARKRKGSQSEESDCDLMSRLKGKPAAKNAKWDDDESFTLDSDSEVVAPRTRPGRAKKVVHYVADDSDSDFGC
ncbi:DNA topoisomerase 2-alpha [Acipenser ruthenus]|uniref:DNA topoisomerase 2-alpha n=1 Tax=Acipenser ruthenus TaxID=7906 RepID=A0A444U9L4_ACIRT|nr:DNA topoisomerase 2-alpha [Acipenser ruthenus]